MTWYRVIEYNPNSWEDTNTILERLGGIHYHTMFFGGDTYRKFALELTEADLIIARLSLSNKVSIDVFETDELERLKDLGYVKDVKKT